MYTDVLKLRKCPRADKRNKKQENGKNVTEQTWEGKYSTLSGKTYLVQTSITMTRKLVFAAEAK